MRKTLIVAGLALAPLLAGCPVTQSQNTPVSQFRRADSATGRPYWLYVPSDYDGGRACPLVITLHGTHGFDSASAQIKEWKALAEEHGFIVAAPELKSPQGILPVFRSQRLKNLSDDEQVILDCLRDIRAHYSIDPRAVLLTGFSAGGYAMYYAGLRNPGEFTALAARACNSDNDVLDAVTLTDQARKLPVIIIHGRDDLGPIGRESWAAYRWLREHGCAQAEHHKIQGGHIRQPQIAWRYWSAHLPKELRSRGPL